MPICKQCNSSFPNLVYTDGKKHDLHKRRCCLICSPLGSSRKSQNGLKKICGTCFKTYIYTSKSTIKLCQACSIRKRKFFLKDRMITYKGGKCSSCGYNKCSRALEFHHRNASDKIFTLGHGYGHKWVDIKTELDKCDILCSNCHRELEEKLSIKKQKFLLITPS